MMILKQKIELHLSEKILNFYYELYDVFSKKMNKIEEKFRNDF